MFSSDEKDTIEKVLKAAFNYVVDKKIKDIKVYQKDDKFDINLSVDEDSINLVLDKGDNIFIETEFPTANRQGKIITCNFTIKK